jgi:GlpG protein
MIGTISIETNAHRFSAFLTRSGIDNRCEVKLDPVSGRLFYQIWVADEDRLEEAKKSFARQEANPADPAFDIILPVRLKEEPSVEEEEEVPWTRRLTSPVTSFFFALCVFVYVLNWIQGTLLTKEGEGQTLQMTPVAAVMLYDAPPLDRSLETGSYFRGFSGYFVRTIKKQDTSTAEGPLFVKIREGELWRLFSPCVLHLNLLHILFNMLWLWVLGRPIEQRIGSVRTIVMALIIGVISNTAQYLMSGPLFLGYSGIIMGQAGFIWMRERIASWEGYPIQRATILFILIFILAMVGLQFLSFVIWYFTNVSLGVHIANTAHIVGALVGIALGRMPYFAWRIAK